MRKKGVVSGRKLGLNSTERRGAHTGQPRAAPALTVGTSEGAGERQQGSQRRGSGQTLPASLCPHCPSNPDSNPQVPRGQHGKPVTAPTDPAAIGSRVHSNPVLGESAGQGSPWRPHDPRPSMIIFLGKLSG